MVGREGCCREGIERETMKEKVNGRSRVDK